MFKIDTPPPTSIDTEMAHASLTVILEMARRSHHVFLVYLIGLAMAELQNIERGEPTEI